MKKLYRCRWDRKLGGVFGGLGQYFRVDPNLLRILFIPLMILLGIFPLMIVYFVLWGVLDDGPNLYVQIPGKKLKIRPRRAKLYGVIDALATYFNISVDLLRIIFLVALFATAIFPLLVSYAFAAFILPQAHR